MSAIELTLHSDEHLSTGLYTVAEMQDALSSGASLRVHGSDDPCPSFGVDRVLPARTVAAAEVRTWAVIG